MMQVRPRRAWLLYLAMLALTITPVPLGSAVASCAAPSLVVEGTQGRPVIDQAMDLTVDGRAFVRGCDDTGAVTVNAFGCESSEQRGRTTPMRNVRLLLQQDDKRWVLGAEDAGADDVGSGADGQLGNITWRVRVPADVEAGPAVLVADVPPRGEDALDARLRVLISQP